MAQARVRLTPAGRTPATAFLSGSNPRPAHLTFFPKLTPNSLSAAAAANAPPPHIVVVGSANADIYVEVDRLPHIGETVAARAGRSLAGGKGANQAACGGRLALGPTYLVARVGDDANGRLLEGALADAGGVRTDRVARAADAPSGHAVVMLMPDGQNSIIIVGGANMEGWAAGIGPEDLELIRKAGVLLLQREIPDWVNAQAAQVIAFYLSQIGLAHKFSFFFVIIKRYCSIILMSIRLLGAPQVMSCHSFLGFTATTMARHTLLSPCYTRDKLVFMPNFGFGGHTFCGNHSLPKFRCGKLWDQPNRRDICLRMEQQFTECFEYLMSENLVSKFW